MTTTCQFCNIEHSTTVPTVHLNGTAAEDLHYQLDAAVNRLRAAQKAMVEAAPNGRDYYPQGQQMARIAMGAHERRCLDLNRMLAELEEQRDHVQAVINFKAQQRRQEAR